MPNNANPPAVITNPAFRKLLTKDVATVNNPI